MKLLYNRGGDCMSNKHRGIVKTLYSIIGMIIVGMYTSYYSKDWLGVLLLCYIIFGAILSTFLRLPLFSRLSMYKVSKESYTRADTLFNVLISSVALIVIICSVFGFL